MRTLAAGKLLAAATLGICLPASDVCAEPQIFEGAFEPEAVSSPRATTVRYQERPAVPPADASTDPAGADPVVLDLLDLSLEELSAQRVRSPQFEQEVTTVSGQQSTVGRSPAAVFVVTQEMIRRSGATSIPEALRMVPGLQVARTNSHEWAVTARGFNTNLGNLIANNNKLLVLIDGRSVYSPLFAGVNWDVQDVLLNDIERIEVIRGPGATIWGANAVNGVINIITKRAADTQGGLVTAGGGTEENGSGSARVGGQIGDNMHYRVYGKWFERDASFVRPTTANPTGVDYDDWRQGRSGFRMDWTPSECDLFTFQGDYYEGRNGIAPSAFNPLNADEQVRGGNLLTRWTRTYSDDSDMSLQFYYDRADRENRNLTFAQQVGTYDVDLRYHFPLGGWHNLVCGAGYRSVSDNLTPLTAPPFISFVPDRRTYDVGSVFVQDEITLVPDELFLTLGAKLLTNAFTGFEHQPSARLLWSPEQSWAAWAAVSRAVRIPSRVEHDLRIDSPPFGPIFSFSRDFQSENLMAYEIGYRQQPVEWFSWDMAMFYNQYEDLASLRTTPMGPLGLPIFNANDNRGEGYGVELSAQVDVTPWWKLSGWYSFLQLQIHPGALSSPVLGSTGEGIEGSSPHNQAFLMSTMNLTGNVDFDLMGRYVDNLPFQGVPHYISLDARLAWRPTCGWELSAVGQNLLDGQHPEFGGSATAPPAIEIQRGVYGMVTRTW